MIRFTLLLMYHLWIKPQQIPELWFWCRRWMSRHWPWFHSGSRGILRWYNAASGDPSRLLKWKHLSRLLKSSGLEGACWSVTLPIDPIIFHCWPFIWLLHLFHYRWRDVKLRAFENAKHRTYVDLKVSLNLVSVKSRGCLAFSVTERPAFFKNFKPCRMKGRKGSLPISGKTHHLIMVVVVHTPLVFFSSMQSQRFIRAWTLNRVRQWP